MIDDRLDLLSDENYYFLIHVNLKLVVYLKFSPWEINKIFIFYTYSDTFLSYLFFFSAELWKFYRSSNFILESVKIVLWKILFLFLAP